MIGRWLKTRAKAFVAEYKGTHTTLLKITFCWHILLYCPRERKWCFSYIFQCESSQEQEPGNFIYERFTQTIGSIIVFFSHMRNFNNTQHHLLLIYIQRVQRKVVLLYFAYIYVMQRRYKILTLWIYYILRNSNIANIRKDCELFS